MSYKLTPLEPDHDVMVVGCGGTGGFVAEGLCRLLPSSHPLYLVDPDRVEERNLIRQNFYKEDLGRFKAEALARRLSNQFGREVNYMASPVEELALNERGHLTIGCVDNPKAREILQYSGYGMMGRWSYLKAGALWYIDAGNGEHSGQVLIGNGLLRDLLHGFSLNEGRAKCLPLPQLQQPGLLAPQVKPRPDCARAVARHEQSPVINRMMADLVLTFVHKLLTDTMTWMGAYLDLEAGTMTAVDATPEAVSRITGLTVRQLEYRPRPIKERVEVRV